MAYTKLFSSIVTSTIWMEDDKTRIVWITMLAIADKNGEVQSSIPGLARIAGVSIEDCRVAISKFLAPDPDSRTKDDKGRRIEEIDGGWALLNHNKYREMASKDEQREAEARRKARYRDKLKRNGVSQNVPDMSLDVPKNRHIAEADTEAEASTVNTTPKINLRFAEPSQGEVDLECAKIGLPTTEGTKFVAFYGSKGWKVGKTPMKNWRMALVGWRTRWEENRLSSKKPTLAGMTPAQMDAETARWVEERNAEKEAF